MALPCFLNSIFSIRAIRVIGGQEFFPANHANDANHEKENYAILGREDCRLNPEAWFFYFFS